MYILTSYYVLKETDVKVKHQTKAYKQLFSDALSLKFV